MVQAVVPLSYDEFLANVAEWYAKQTWPKWQRYGQMYYNMLPAEIGDTIVATHLDPFSFDFVSDETHEAVQRLWARRPPDTLDPIQKDYYVGGNYE